MTHRDCLQIMPPCVVQHRHVRCTSAAHTHIFVTCTSWCSTALLECAAHQVLSSSVKAQLAGTPLYLLGMMGSGKSTVGKLLSAALEYCFFDTDSLVWLACIATQGHRLTYESTLA